MRVGAVRWYCPRAKDKKRQKRLGLDVQAVFSQSLRVHNKLHPPPFAREAKRLIYFYSARFSHFIDSLTADTNASDIDNIMHIKSGVFLFLMVFDMLRKHFLMLFLCDFVFKGGQNRKHHSDCGRNGNKKPHCPRIFAVILCKACAVCKSLIHGVYINIRVTDGGKNISRNNGSNACRKLCDKALAEEEKTVRSVSVCKLLVIYAIGNHNGLANSNRADARARAKQKHAVYRHQAVQHTGADNLGTQRAQAAGQRAEV